MAANVCPSCRGVLERDGWRVRCDQCRGSFVDSAALISKVAELTKTPFDLPPIEQRGERPCPICTTSMGRARLWDVEVDRCEAHGVWFDAKELAALVEHAGGWKLPSARRAMWKAFLGALAGETWAIPQPDTEGPTDL